MLQTFSRTFSLLCLVGAIAGCTNFQHAPPLTNESFELVETSFFSQTGYFCGPTALATALQRTGVNVTPDQLAESVFLPGRKGSLQIEMVAATRQHDRLAVQIDPDLNAIISELKIGHPVLVLQNLGIKWIPVWHYAVVVGYDATTDSFVLRSGTEFRRMVTRKLFFRSWTRANNWAIVVLKQGELPSSDDSENYVQAVVGLEQVGKFDTAVRAYQAGANRWPNNRILLFGLGNSLYGAHDFEAAVNAYRRLLSLFPDYVPASNNLAQALADLGCRKRALAVLDAVESQDTAYSATLSATYSAISGQESRPCPL